MKGDDYKELRRLCVGVDAGKITDPESVYRVKMYRENLAKNREAAKRRRAKREERQEDAVKDPPPKRVAQPDFDESSSLTPLQKSQLLECIAELADRQNETLRLYKPMPIQKQFHESRAHIRIIRGGNRSGKTTASMCELAYALMGTHPDQGKYPYGRCARSSSPRITTRSARSYGGSWGVPGRSGCWRTRRPARRAWRPQGTV